MGASPSGGNYVGQRSQVWQPSDAPLTRPNNTTAYSAHVGLGSGSSCLFKFSNFFPVAGGTGLLTGMRLHANAASIAATNMGAIRGHLYNASPASAPASDQATFNSLFANLAANLGFGDFSTWSIGGGSSDIISSYAILAATPLPIFAPSGARDLYLLLEATAAFTPIASAIIMPSLSATFD